MNPSEPSKRVAIIGGGISGLATAHYLAKTPGVEVVLYEASQRLGGLIRTERVDGFIIESGPDVLVRMKPAAIELCKELGLGDELIDQPLTGRGVHVVRGGKLIKLPDGLMLGVPRDPWPTLRSPLLSWKGKARLFLEPFLPKAPPDQDETVAAFIERRLGVEAAAQLATPLLEGVFAGSADELSMQACFPQLAGLEQRYGSLVVGAALMGKTAPGGAVPSRAAGVLKALGGALSAPFQAEAADAPGPFVTLRGGLEDMVDALARELRGVSRLGATAERVSRDEHGWRLTVRGEGERVFDDVVVALPAYQASELVPSAELASELSKIKYSRVAVAFLGYRRADAAGIPEGSGVIVPRGEGKIVSVTLMNQKWAGRAGEQDVLFRVFLGGARGATIMGVSDEDLLETAATELHRLLGVSGEPKLTRLFRVLHGTPMPGIGHAALLEKIEAGFKALPGLHWVAAGFGGIGITDCVGRAKAISRAIVGAV